MTQGRAQSISIGKAMEFVEVVRKAPQIQQELDVLQQEIEQTEIEGKAGECVCVVVSGVGEPIRVVISQNAMALDSETLADLLKSAMQDVRRQSISLIRTKLIPSSLLND